MKRSNARVTTVVQRRDTERSLGQVDRRRLGGIEDYLAWLGGGAVELLREVPSDKARYAQFGILLLGRAALFAGLFGYAVTVCGFPLIAGVAAGLFWGLIDITAERFLVTVLGRSLTSPRQAAIALVAIVLSALIAMLVTPSIAVSLITVASQPRAGLLPLWEALSQLTARDIDAQVAVWAIFGFFWLIRLMPIMAKLLANLAPLTAYDQLLKAEEDQLVDRIRVQRMQAQSQAEKENEERMALADAESAARIAVAQDKSQREAALGIAANRVVADQLEELVHSALRTWQERVRATLATNEDWDPDAELAKLSDFARGGQDVISAVQGNYPSPSSAVRPGQAMPGLPPWRGARDWQAPTIGVPEFPVPAPSREEDS
jgi:hypothetical protein